ncbi:MAG: Lrp/AsnC ligand binding domain-containing protein [Candidatus Heimdallarchaeota archaeon]|nr:Lrp/AsnC ligand binding domain-containing protein [Candidatus Heimdallarchaeota archaeon]MDH5644395.1 Lrp/AsnC ligand binding domain-containing protein [Candidatus Heimdallarchaeota archaeon]
MPNIFAYVFINLEFDQEDKDIISPLLQIEQVVEAHRILGVYDIIVLISADTPKELKDITISVIRKINHVKSTITMISLDHHITNN